MGMKSEVGILRLCTFSWSDFYVNQIGTSVAPVVTNYSYFRSFVVRSLVYSRIEAFVT